MATLSSASDRRFILLLLLAGIALRLIWLVQVHEDIATFVGAGEATRAALALARTGSFADAYFEGYGPTAHLLPVTPAIAGALLWLFGPGSAAANIALLTWSLAQICAAILLLGRLFDKLGADPLAVRWGTALLFLVPAFAPQEVVEFRYWEGALGVCLLCVNLLFLLDLHNRALRRWDFTRIAALTAVTFFTCPPVGIAVYACWAIFALRSLPLRRALQLGLGIAAALTLLIAPWALRNVQALGTPVILRSNFGLEFALANHPATLSDQAPENVFADRLLAIHPYHSVPARTALKSAGGEVAYARGLGAQAGQWASENPGGFTRLALRHVRQFFFPEPWQMYFTGWEGARLARSLAITLVSLLGLLGLAFGLRSSRRGYALLAVSIGLIALPYAIVQPVPRYTYLVYGLLAFLAAEAVVRTIRYRANASGLG